jgi:alkyldihydroxyacetonephosphate synthase
MDAIVASGATITHHHAVGTDHQPWLEAEIGPVGIALLRAAKAAVDPAGILNPGVLVP